ncbi:MAG: glycoside hydrolase family 2 [Bacteroidetes bacterium 24-39-8]|nr:MAG: glycoside hydrolase family 2 [Bacteroidetes bacterium 24-39-8]HQS54366.1 glycoside hydrolase family 2 TIM barrel-domain containing protein [Sediminibacterium sp.]
MLSIKIRWVLLLLVLANFSLAQNIPLPEHPRPDFERANWINLNGAWDFEFDSLNTGLSNDWQKGKTNFTQKINVPFPWGSPLSGVKDLADYAWYKKSIQVPVSWSGQRIFVTVGASDWETSIWLDGVLVGTHNGGYTAFSFELTKQVKYGTAQQLVIRVDDKRRDFALYGKQGYGNARGIWQTIYLEGRGQTHLETIHFTPDIDKQTVKAALAFSNELNVDTEIKIRIKTSAADIVSTTKVLKSKAKADIQIAIPNPRLWNLEDPFLYEAEISLGDDIVKSYFGMRKISVMNLPNTDYPYVALNNKPIYLQLTLDQSYHPDGFYTFPTDAFMKNEIVLAKEIGLNGIRTHIKVDVPRKLYWADKLGLLVMSDLPNAWGEPDAAMQAESEFTLREMIKRDFNHPSIFSWITFNETWGLQTKVKENGKTRSQYLPQTQNWVASMYYLAKSLDPTRLVEDNSVCCGRGHTETDINSWHEYLPGWAWEDHLANLTSKTFEGSTDHFEKGFKQGLQPNINSECGNVWGYDGSTGDVDWSWDYHRMINTFRKYPKVAGWLYTEHHDVINEWNGYWRFDRTQKFTGLSQMMEGMSDKDFHSAFYISTGNEISKNLQAGTVLELPLYLSAMTGAAIKDNQLVLEYDLDFMDKTGESKKLVHEKTNFPYQPWLQQQLPSLTIKMPNYAGLGIVQLRLKDKDGKLLHSNFMHVVVKGGQAQNNTIILEQEVGKYSKAEFSNKVWKVLDGLKVNGAGKGFIEYQIPVPANLDLKGIKTSYILVEASAKQLFDKDRGEGFEKDQDYMLGAKVSPHKNPNAYPMTDETLFPSVIKVSVNGKTLKTETLPDDPADHRGVLSWNSQLKDKKLREAGSYGYLIKVPISNAVLKQAAAQGFLSLKLSTEAEGGIAVYGSDFGRYPINPSIVIKR